MNNLKRNPMVPIVLIFLLMAVNSLMRGGYSNPMDWIMEKLLILPGIIIGLSFHEFGHAYVSTKLGDPTPKQQGRVTINPLAHIDPVGMVCLLFAGFGWGIPVQINPSYYKNRRKGEIMVGFAGVAMNLILAIVFSLLVRVASMAYPMMGPDLGQIGQIVYQILFNVVGINVVLMVFNLLPVPPLDGFGIVTNLFHLEKYSWYQQYYQWGYFILIFLVLLGVVGAILGPVTTFIMTLLSPLMGV